MTEGFSGKRAAEIVGITYRQLDYWARTDLIRPSLADAQGSGSRRRYSYRNLLELKVIKTLLDAGIKLESVRGRLQLPPREPGRGRGQRPAGDLRDERGAGPRRPGAHRRGQPHAARACSTCSPSTTCAARWTTPSSFGPRRAGAGAGGRAAVSGS